MAEIELTSNEQATPALAGVIQVVPIRSTLPSGKSYGKSAVRVGPDTGWFNPRGIRGWAREACFIARADATPSFARSLRGTLPLEQIAPKRYPLAARAAEGSPLVALAPNLAADTRALGVRVHSIGVDRVSAGFFYFAEGGTPEPVRAHGNLIEMLLPSMGSSATNAEIAVVLEDLLDRLLTTLSGGAVSELAVELADALPHLARDGTGLVGVDLDAFESNARALADRFAAWSGPMERLAERLSQAERAELERTAVPLFKEAVRERLPPLDVLVSGRPLRLPAQHRWVVQGRSLAELDAPVSPPHPPAAAASVFTAAAANVSAPAAPTSPAHKVSPAPVLARVALGASSDLGGTPATPAAAAAPPPAAAPTPRTASAEPRPALRSRPGDIAVPRPAPTGTTPTPARTVAPSDAPGDSPARPEPLTAAPAALAPVPAPDVAAVPPVATPQNDPAALAEIESAPPAPALPESLPRVVVEGVAAATARAVSGIDAKTEEALGIETSPQGPVVSPVAAAPEETPSASPKEATPAPSRGQAITAASLVLAAAIALAVWGWLHFHHVHAIP
jgi:hypothetical protein